MSALLTFISWEVMPIIPLPDRSSMGVGLGMVLQRAVLPAPGVFPLVASYKTRGKVGVVQILSRHHTALFLLSFFLT